jgi:hypothetical protein
MEDGRPPTHLSPEDMSDLMEDAALILDTLETMNLVQRAGHGLSKSSTSNKVKDAVVNSEMNMTSSNNHRCYSMHESVSVFVLIKQKLFILAVGIVEITQLLKHCPGKSHCRSHVKAKN